jgi:hypothetical protein
MVIDSMTLFWLKGISDLLLFVLGFIAIRHAYIATRDSKSRWRRFGGKKTDVAERRAVPVVLMRMLFINTESTKLSELRALLAGCGLSIEPALFEAVRRVGIIVAAALGMLSYGAFKSPVLTLYIPPQYTLVASVVLLILLFGYRIILESLKRRRAQRIVKEIFALSNQLLYYSGSSMNLHAKLNRCLPFTRTIRPALQTLLNEWYQDAEVALKRFKVRLGTSESYSFAETMNSLRLNDNESYYELIRERIDDYKQTIELMRESRKETVSYVLFILAGLPILNTFRLFLYPWVMEGQRLFQTLN